MGATKGALMAKRNDSSHPHLDEINTVLTLLEAGIPLTLLLDLAMPIHSADVYHDEAGSADWLYAVVA
jgi:hypothetical protein